MNHRKETIAMYLPAMAGGGAELVFALLSGEFVSRGYGVDLVLNSRSGPMLERVPRGVEIVDLGASRSLTALPRLARYLRSTRPAALLSALEVSNVIASWARTIARVKTRVVVSVHAVLSNTLRIKSNWQYKALPAVLGRAYGRADAIIAVSDAVADDLAAVTRIPRNRIRRIYNPLPPALLEVDDSERQTPSLPTVLGVGRLVPEKDFGTLLRAFALRRATADLRLLILGEGPERGPLERLARDLGIADSVMFAGHVPNPTDYMRNASLVVVSSRTEGFGNVLIEALGCGTPVVSTRCPGGPAEILANGKYGPLVPVGDHDAMARAIDATLREPLPVALLRSRARDFELGRIAEQYLASLVGGQHA